MLPSLFTNTDLFFKEEQEKINRNHKQYSNHQLRHDDIQYIIEEMKISPDKIVEEIDQTPIGEITDAKTDNRQLVILWEKHAVKMAGQITDHTVNQAVKANDISREGINQQTG